MTGPHQPDDVHFLRGQVWPRAGAILGRPRVAIVVGLGAITAVIAPHLPLGRVAISTLSTAGLAFAALAFGACVTGAVLALTLPGKDARTWATTRSPSGRHSIFSDLLFVFLWSAVAQLAVVVAAVLGLIFGGDRPAAPPGAWLSDQAALALAATVFFYAVVQLVTVVSTISQVGFVRIAAWNQAAAE